MGTSSASSTLELLTSVPADWMIIGGFLVLLIAIALRLGIAVVCALGVATLLTPTLISLLPGAQFLGSLANAAQSTPVVFLGIFTVIFFVLYQILASDFEHNSPFAAIIGSVGSAILILVMFHATPVLHGLWDFTPLIDSLFSEAYRFWWIAGSLGALVFSRL